MQLHWKVHSKDDRPREVYPGDDLAARETDILTADVDAVVTWREVELGVDGSLAKVGGWNGPYTIPAGRDLGDPDDRRTDQPGYGKRRTLADGLAIELSVTPVEASSEPPIQLFLKPEIMHLEESEVARMAVEIGKADMAASYYLDHATQGLGEGESLKEGLVHVDAGQAQIHRSPQARVREFAALWPELEATLEACLRKLPSRPTVHREMGSPRAGRQDAASIRRNLAEGRLDPSGRPLRDQLHISQRVRDLDTPTLAGLVSSVQQLNQLLATLTTQSHAGVTELEREIKQLEEQNQWHGKLKRKKAAELREANKPYDCLRGLKPLEISAASGTLKSMPSRQTAMAQHDPDHRHWYALVDQVEGIMQTAETLARERRLAASARRRTWELYEYWVTYRVYEHLTGTLKFLPDEQNNWRSLERTDRENGTLYGLQPGASITLRHASRLAVTLTVEKRTTVPSTLRNEISSVYITPDLTLDLTGDTRDVTGQPSSFYNSPGLRPLIVDAKMQDLAPWNGRGAKLAGVLKHSSERYQRVVAGTPGYPRDTTPPMAFLAHPGRRQMQGNRERFRAWPARTQATDEGIPAGLRPEHLPYLNGVLLLRPSPEGSDPAAALFGHSDVHKLVTAWLMENRVFWVCVHCGNNLAAEADQQLHRLAVKAHKSRQDPGDIPKAPEVGDEGARRWGVVHNLHLVCPQCENVLVVSHCEVTDPSRRCVDARWRATHIYKQFGHASQQAGWLGEAVRRSWSHEEVTSQGEGVGNSAVWNRPCPKCGRERQPSRASGPNKGAT